MSESGNLLLPTDTSLEEGSESSLLDALSYDGETSPLAAPHSGEKLAWRVAALSVTVLATMGAAYGSAFHRHHFYRQRADLRPQSVEQKFYDAGGAYWQAPGRGISSSEVWASCDHPHMHVCDGYCCCDTKFYWESPKTLYVQAKKVLKKAAIGAAAHGGHTSVDAEAAVKEAAVAMGKAAVLSMTDMEQKCLPQADVPGEVVKALEDSIAIPGSSDWMTCSTFTSNSHTCGDYCCCNGGFSWSAGDEGCTSEP